VLKQKIVFIINQIKKIVILIKSVILERALCWLILAKKQKDVTLMVLEKISISNSYIHKENENPSNTKLVVT